MRSRCTLGLLVMLVSGTVTVAQTPALPVLPDPTPPTGILLAPVNTGVSPTVFQGPGPSSIPRVWLGVDYLLWWVKDAPNNLPLVTTGPFNPNTFVPGVSPTPAALGSPGTSVLYGNNSIDFHSFSGLRLQGGVALSDDGFWGVEGSAFLLQSRTSSFAAQSNGAGLPFLGRPVIGSFSGQENTIGIAFPNDAANVNGGLAGGVTVATTSRLWGAETNLTATWVADDRLRVTGLVGFRYLDLKESMQIQDHFTPIGQPLFAPAFNGGAVAVGDTVTRTDAFQTQNRFYGGQVGLRANYFWDNFDVSLVGKLALGNNAERISINGSSALQSTGQTLAGGVLALPSNIGTFNQNRFAVIPEVGLNLGYQVNSWMKLQVGYTFLYWNQVVRPDGTIDRTVNRTTVPTDQLFTAGAVGARPAPRFDQTDFWAQGINFGVQFRY